LSQGGGEREPYENRGRDCNDVATNQRTPAATTN
jgi:hypothetical protein